MKNRITLLLTVLLLLTAFFACGCGGAAQEPVSTPEPTPIPTPEPTPVPTPEPVMTPGDEITVDGTLLESGSFMWNDCCYMKLSEAAEALDLSLQEEDGSISFQWYGEQISLEPDTAILYQDGIAYGMKGRAVTCRGEVYIPVESFCDALDISLFDDEEYSHLYCTPGAGDWELAEGYKVPVFMYHSVSDYIWAEPELFVSPSRMEDQLKYLVENGYDPIWFEDLREIEKYDKPVILTFDDGWENNFTDLLPLLEKYQVKATFFIITSMLERQYHGMNTEQLLEVAASGLVSIQSHTVKHYELPTLSYERQEQEMSQSKLELTRLTGKEPFVLCYPRGAAAGNALELLPNYYRFGVKMGGPVYYTGDDPRLVYRYYVSRGWDVDDFAEALEAD